MVFYYFKLQLLSRKWNGFKLPCCEDAFALYKISNNCTIERYLAYYHHLKIDTSRSKLNYRNDDTSKDNLNLS